MAHSGTLTGIYGDVNGELSDVSARLEEVLSRSFGLLGDCGYGTELLRGKLVRPALVLMSGKLYRDDVTELVNLAVASELIHVATLIHDDVVDSAEVRRGIPAVNVRWDNRSAVLSGDSIVCEGLLLLCEYRRIQAADVMVATLKRVVEGELRQLHSHGTLDETTCIEVAREKTGSLMSTLCCLPAMWFGGTPMQVESLAQFGEHVGVAFQIVDDVLDVTGETLSLGKVPLNDIRNGKRTLPLVYLQEVLKDNQAVKDRLSRPAGSDAPQDREIAWVSELMRESGCTERALDRASGYVQRAKGCLEVFPDSPAKDALLNLSDFVVEREF